MSAHNCTVYIVIPVHNRREYTRQCLLSLQKQTWSNHHIIIVDDGSSDGTKEMLTAEFPRVIVIPGQGNLFWTAAVNLGIRFALAHGADYVMTLNNDTVAHSNFVENMLHHAQQNPDALIGALDVDLMSGEKYYGGELVNWRWDSSRYLLDELPLDAQKGLHEVSLLPGRGLLIPRNVFDVVGLFAEKKFPHYMADYDFTLMAKRKGFSLYCNYDATLFTYPEEGGDHKIRKHKSLQNYFKHLFGIHGGGNLRNFTAYAFRNCPPNDLVPALIMGYVRRLTGYWLK